MYETHDARFAARTLHDANTYIPCNTQDNTPSGTNFRDNFLPRLGGGAHTTKMAALRRYRRWEDLVIENISSLRISRRWEDLVVGEDFVETFPRTLRSAFALSPLLRENQLKTLTRPRGCVVLLLIIV